jgi:large subunit ribosomal protein L17
MGRTLGRKTNHRLATFRNMSVALLTHGQITTTLPTAKAVQPFVERLISAAKKGDVASRRRVIALLGNDKPMLVAEEGEGIERNKYGELTKSPKVVPHLFDTLAGQFKDRNGGYTRIIKLARHRIGDGASLVVLQLVGAEDKRVAGNGALPRRKKGFKRAAFAAKLANKEVAAPAAE